jgi:DNA polymerase-3 subunit epsilon
METACGEFCEWRVKQMIKKLDVRELTFFDVETPNSGNDSICAIGVIHFEEDAIKYKHDYLINPEARFDNLNMEIHGITPKWLNKHLNFQKYGQR